MTDTLPVIESLRSIGGYAFNVDIFQEAGLYVRTS